MGLEPITVCLEGRDSSHWATPARSNKAHALYKNHRCCQNFFRKTMLEPIHRWYDLVRQEYTWVLRWVGVDIFCRLARYRVSHLHPASCRGWSVSSWSEKEPNNRVYPWYMLSLEILRYHIVPCVLDSLRGSLPDLGSLWYREVRDSRRSDSWLLPFCRHYRGAWRPALAWPAWVGSLGILHQIRYPIVWQDYRFTDSQIFALFG